jgi:hypothetical protein
MLLDNIQSRPLWWSSALDFIPSFVLISVPSRHGQDYTQARALEGEIDYTAFSELRALLRREAMRGPISGRAGGGGGKRAYRKAARIERH